MCKTTTTVCKKQKEEEEEEKKSRPLEKDEEWLQTFDIDAFYHDMQALGKQLERQQGSDDVKHLEKIVLWSNLCGIIGLLTLGWMPFNPIAIFGLSFFTFTRWTIIAHHTCHGGFDKCKSKSSGKKTKFYRWTCVKFAVGGLWRRFCDWFDWMLPEAWNVEHNVRHHFHLSEVDDPDLVEQNLQELRQMNFLPLWIKYLVVAFMACTWKWFYYAPNTYKEYKLSLWRRTGKPVPIDARSEEPMTMRGVLMGDNPFYSATEFLTLVVGPYCLFYFLGLSLPWLLLQQLYNDDGDKPFFFNALINLICAEIMTNLHGFLMVTTNHAGDDLYRFRRPCRPYSASFYLRQVLASVNFAAGDDVTDFTHGWLNYQIEHHLWPNLTMKSYQNSAPLVRAICRKHQVPYLQQSVWKRLIKTVDIMVGTADMKWFPQHYEDLFLELDVLRRKRASELQQQQ